MNAFIFGTKKQAAKSGGSYRVLGTYSSLVCLIAFPYYNLAQCLEVLQYIAVIWAHKIVVEKNTGVQVR